ncbi:cyclic GMP-AMP synthase-like isoform X2 [Centruroides sculpturatus]|nr:cyclic GMP-AMP synthase-like isoform X2 [Centruroides sculpturatus]
MKKKSFLFYVNEILRDEVKLNGQEENVEVLRNTLNWLITEMKKYSPLFTILYKDLYYTGSYYENLRVKNATEFDINILLHFPFENFNLQIEPDTEPKGFARCRFDGVKLDELTLTKNVCSEVYAMFHGHYLLPEKIKSWLQKIICNITEKTEYNIEGVKKIITRRNGPAMTIQIHCEKVIIDVDLVPVIEFPNWPSDASCSFLEDIPEKVCDIEINFLKNYIYFTGKILKSIIIFYIIKI